ncbi:hypothetical protein CHU95_07350 [Niveispirillum lacus]|uniref:EAL domain-containing protein n=1 Tax=Niveispirillum lacus TaxID=1981099 RepID=A0A255Z3S2_9PROT|nr:EAL domain-containing protein [Niveispirillum lacus]OYQ35535.1 hypothetical protein CHU95_07350 [Niveispirillum lacus]
MLTGTAGLLRLLSDGNSRGTAVVVDLAEVPHAENPLFRQSVVNLLDNFAAQFQPEVVDVGRYTQVFLFEETNAHPFISKLKAVAVDFSEQHMGAPRFTIYHLPHDAGRLAAMLKRLAPAVTADPPPTLTAAEQQQLAGIHKLAVYEKVLVGADVSALVRESPVWRWGRDRSWTLEFAEVTVALDHLERAVGTPLRRDPWLLQQITPVLDRRVIRHFQQEPSRLATAHSLNLQWRSVLGPVFLEFVRDLTYEQRRNMIVEISALDAELTADGLADAVDTLRLWDCRIAIDHLSLRHTDPGYLPLAALDYLKLDLGGLPLDATGELPPLPTWMQQFGADRIVAIHPRNREALQACMALGLSLVEQRDRPMV